MVDSNLVAVCIASLALIFTVGTFWWLQMRRGHLNAYSPHSFSAFIDGTLILFLRLPILLYNTGAEPIVVLDMRLRFPEEPQSLFPLPWRLSYLQLAPVNGEVGQHPAVFAVAGRSTGQSFLEFGGPWPGFKMYFDSTYLCLIEAKLGHNGKWKKLIDFELVLPRMTNPGEYTAYRNSPWEPTIEDKAKIAAVRSELRARIDQLRDSTDQSSGQSS